VVTAAGGLLGGVIRKKALAKLHEIFLGYKTAPDDYAW